MNTPEQTTSSPQYRITTSPQQTMFGKRTGGHVARMESDWSGNIAAAAGPTPSAAKLALISQLGRLAANPERAYIFCGDAKTILVVSFAGDAWQYDIIGAERERSGCYMPGCTSFKAAKEQAYAHAEQSYGGVLATK